jgi:hypothetical protein
MQMKILLISGFFFLQLHLVAQPCIKYEKAMAAGAQYQKQGKFDKAIIEFMVAQIAGRECGMGIEIPTHCLKSVFDSLQIQLKNAEIAGKIAEREKKKAEKALAAYLKEKERSALLENDYKEIKSKNAEMQRVLDNAGIGLSSFEGIGNDNSKDTGNIDRAEKEFGDKDHRLSQTNIKESDPDLKARYLQLKSIVDSIENNGNVLSNQIHYDCLAAALEYCYDLLDRLDMNEALQVISFYKGFFEKHPPVSAGSYFICSRLEGVSAVYYSYKDDYKNELDHNIIAIDYSRKAINIESSNQKYKRTLVVLLDNMSKSKDSSLNEKKRVLLREEAREIAYAMENEAGIDTTALDQIIKLRYADASDLVDKKKSDSAKRILSHYITRLNNIVSVNFQSKELYLWKALMEIKQSEIAAAAGDSVASRKFISDALHNWLVVFNTDIREISNLYLVKDGYNGMNEIVTKNFSDRDKRIFYSQISNHIRPLNSKAIYIPDISKIVINVYRHLYELSSGDLSLEYLSQSISVMESGNTLAVPAVFNDEFEQYAEVYLNILEIYVEKKNGNMVSQYFGKIKEIFYPVLEKYPYDYYLRNKLIQANKIAGVYFMENGEYRKAKPLLEYASVWGIGSCSRALAELYRKGKFEKPDLKKANEYQDLSSRQFFKKFTISGISNKEKVPIDVYISELPENTPYKGIDDQIEWLKMARNILIPEETRNVFIKLQEIAWSSNLSYPDLCTYAIGAAGKKEDELNIAEQNRIVLNESMSFDDRKAAHLRLIKIRNINYISDSTFADRDRLFNEVIKLSLLLIKNKKSIEADSIIAIYVRPVSTELLSFKRLISEIENANDELLMSEAALRLLKENIRNGYNYAPNTVAGFYNTTGWNQLINGKFVSSEKVIREGIGLMVSSMYLYSNLPAILLLQGKFEEAKDLYIRWKDIPFDAANGYPTYREAFLADIKLFEKRGIIPSVYQNDVEKIKGLLIP